LARFVQQPSYLEAGQAMTAGQFHLRVAVEEVLGREGDLEGDFGVRVPMSAPAGPFIRRRSPVGRTGAGRTGTGRTGIGWTGIGNTRNGSTAIGRATIGPTCIGSGRIGRAHISHSDGGRAALERFGGGSPRIRRLVALSHVIPFF